MPWTKALPEPGGAEDAPGGEAAALYRMITGHWVAQIVRAAADLRLADHVAAGADEPARIADLEGADPAAVSRLVRACVSVGLLSWDGTGLATTPMGELLRRDAPGSLREAALVQGAHGHWQVAGLLPQAVRSGRNQARAALGLEELEGAEGLEGFERAERAERFGEPPYEAAPFAGAARGMIEPEIEELVALLDLDGAGTVLDVGGCDTALVLALMAAHPEVRGLVLDRPYAVDAAQEAAARVGLEERFRAVAGSFFVEVPTADYYLLRWILHEWPDEECVAILRNCRASAKPGARLLVAEAVLGELGTPDPAALLDMNMLAGTRGRERELAEFDALFAASGWRRAATRPVRAGMTTVCLLELETV